MTTGQNQPTFTRRKFTNTETLDNVLCNLAEEHYQGNVSLCLRAAIEDHRKTLAGTKDEIVVAQMTGQINSLQTQQEEIRTILDELSEQGKATNQQRETQAAVETTLLTDVQQTVYDELVQADEALRMEDIVERTTHPIVDVQPALGKLMDWGYVTVTNGTSQRFQVVGKADNAIQRD